MTADAGMGEWLVQFDWSATSLGPRERWPQSLQSVVRLAMSSRFPQLILWGPELVQIYNDAYRPVLGTKHPTAYGQSARDCWPELWPVIGPMFDRVFSTGVAIAAEDMEFVFERHGYAEETYFTFSYSPVFDEGERVSGILVTCFETTRSVLSERRVRVLGELAAEAARVKSVSEAWTGVARVFAAHSRPIPFALVYATAPDGQSATLAVCTGLAPGSAAAPREIPLRGAGSASACWPLARAQATGHAIQLDDLKTRFSARVTESTRHLPRSAVISCLQLPGNGTPAGFLVLGVNPRRALDDHYRQFLSLVASHVATAFANGRAHESERQRAEELAALDRAKTAFFSNVSHEFRTPLTLLLGPLEDVLRHRGNELSAPVRNALQVAHRNAVRLLKLVNSLLEFSRLEAGRVQVTFEETDLAVFTREIANVFRTTIEQAGLRFVVETHPLPAPVFVDREMWEKIVLNLLSNAFKFTLEGEIRLTLEADGSVLRLVVADTGVGIAESEMPRIFDRFHGSKSARGRSYEGTGIGLASVQEMVRLHGGTIEVQSRLEEGSQFAVTLPLGHAHLPPERVQRGSPAALHPTHAVPFLSEAQRWTDTMTDGGFADDAADALGGEPATRPDPARVLVVDDNSDVRDYVAALLHTHYNVLTAADGEHALDVIAAQLPDLVIADVMMPRCDGFSLVRRLRADPKTKTLPVILISGRAGEESRLEGLYAGADDYLAKPFPARELVARVDSQIQLSRVRRAAELRERELREVAEAGRNRLQLLTELSPLLLRVSPDVQQTLAQVTRLVVPRVADWCYIDLLDEAGRRDRMAVYHPDPDKLREGEDVFRRFPPRPDAPWGSALALREGRALLYPQINHEMLQAVAYDEAHLAIIRAANLRSAMFAPMIGRERCLGVIAFLATGSGRPYDEQDLDLAKEIATRAALALENARNYAAIRELNADLDARVQERTRELARMQRQYQLLFEASPLPMFVLDRRSKRFLAVNDAALALYGYTRDEMLSRGVRDMRPGSGDKFFVACIPRRQNAGQRLAVWQHRRKDGVLMELEMAIGQLTWDGKPALIVLANDVTERRRAQESLRRANEMLQTLFDAAPVAIVGVDRGGRVMSWNAGAETIFGWTAAEAIGRVCPTVPQDGMVDFHALLQRVLQGDAPDSQLVRWRRKKTGERILASISVAPLRDAAGSPAGVIAIVEDVTAQERARAEIQSYSERLARLSRQLLEAQELERRRIARELHDEIGQSLTLFKLHLEQAQRAWPAGGIDALGNLRSGVERLLGDVRQLCLQLRPALLDDLGLLPALLAHIDRFNESNRVRCVLHHEGIEARRFPPVIETTAFRVVQEALTNVVRHAETAEVTATIWADDQMLQVRVEDHGRGFEVEQALRAGTSSGLAGMQERAKLAAGELSIVARPGHGTCITLELPLPAGNEFRKEPNV